MTKYLTSKDILAEIRVSHERLLAAVMNWRKVQDRETRSRLDQAEAEYEDAFRLLHDPERPYRDRHGRPVAKPPKVSEVIQSEPQQDQFEAEDAQPN